MNSSVLAVENAPRTARSIYDSVAAVLRERYYNQAFRENELVALIEQFRPEEGEPADLKTQRAAAEKLLAHIPASHLGLLSEESQGYLVAELTGTKRPTFGFQAVRIGRDYFTFFVLEGGPAEKAGIRPWERLVSLDGEPPERSARLDYAQKDAFLSEERDPPLHSILARAGDEITAELERKPGETRAVRLRAEMHSALEAARTSARMFEAGGHRIAYAHLWFIHATGVPELLRELFAGQFAQAEGLMLDLRGRGGNGFAVADVLDVLSKWRRPIVALTDRQSRSAKDVLAYEFKERKLATVVRERTAGAVIPASFAPVGEKNVLMFPSFTLGEYTEKLELKGGVEPDVFVERAGPYSAGEDPIFRRGQEELLRVIATHPRATPAPARETATPSQISIPGSTQPLPSTDSLIGKMIEALGGEKAVRAHAHRTLRGMTELIGLPMKGEFVQKASAPDKSLVEMHLGDLLVRQGFDGTIAWLDNPMGGKQILKGAAAEAVRQQAQFHGPLQMRAAYREIVPAAFVEFDGKPCLEVKLVSDSGVVSNIYVETATYVTAGSRATVETPIGPVQSTTYFRNYRDFDGYRAPAEIYIDSSVQRQMIRIDSVSFEKIAPSEYAPPDDAK